MIPVPRRQTLVSQTTGILRREIENGTWGNTLPGERLLCETLQVSRNTLRGALNQLKREGLLKAVAGSGTHIQPKAGTKPGGLHSHDVAVLCPEPIEQLRPTHTLWIDELRWLLSGRSCRLRFFHGRQYFRNRSGAALKRLVSQNPHGCWILIFASEPVMRWFAETKVPCVVAGSVYPGINLPWRDLDHRAICRHAAGVMLGAGHRKIALLIRKSRRAGDLESESGFLEGARQSTHREAEAVVAYHQATYASLSAAVTRLMQGTPAPTAILVANAYHYLTAVTRIMSLGFNVPKDVSLVSRDEDPFLAFLHPTVAHYAISSHQMARALSRPVYEILETGAASAPSGLIMPDFVRGDSLAPPAQPRTGPNS